MKILIATPSLLPNFGGPAYSVASIAKHLENSSNQITIITSDDNYVKDIKSLSQWDLIRNFGMWSYFNHHISYLAKQEKKPLILSPLGMLEPWALKQKKLKKHLAWHLYQRKDIERCVAIHATAQSEADNIRNLGIKRPIAIIPHGIEIPPNNIIDIKPKLSAPIRTALFISRIHPKKGLLELIKAWAKVEPVGWRMLIAGPDDNNHRIAVEESIRKYGLQGIFIFLGLVQGEQKTNLLLEAELFILPTHSENFGLVIAEALAHGLPVLTTTGAPWSELVETQSGWWTNPDVDSIAEVLYEATNLPPSKLIEMGERGRSLVSERYTWPAVIDKHIRLHQWITGYGQKPEFIID